MRGTKSLSPLCRALWITGALFGCGREDVELAAPSAPPPPAEDCSAEVPIGLPAARPPMGWNGYNAFGCASELNEAKVRSTADALVASGMQSAGYTFVNLDACWQLDRAEDGTRQFDPSRLPSGIQALSDYLHARGLSLGVFSRGEPCMAEPGGAGFEAIDAASYETWGVDYVKTTSCPGLPVSERTMVDLATELAARRPTVLSLASPPFREWMRDVVSIWRTSDPSEPTWTSLLRSLDATIPLAAYARPGAFNDPDMLEIGNEGLTAGEERAQFAVWSILSAPLIAGNDLTVMTESTRALLTHRDLIAINQDALGLQAAPIQRDADLEILAKPIAACGARAVVILNRGTASVETTVTWRELWLEPGAVTVRDLWTNSPVPAGPESFTVTVPGHDAAAFVVTGVEPPLPRGRVALSDLRWTYASNGYGPVELDLTNGEEEALDGRPIRLRGATYEKGLGVHGPSLIRYRLGRACTRFRADVGIDDDSEGRGSAQFEVWADGVRLFQSGVLTGTSPARSVDLDVNNRRELRLFVGIGGDNHTLDHAVWAGATLECNSSTVEQENP